MINIVCTKAEATLTHIEKIITMKLTNFPIKPHLAILCISFLSLFADTINVDIIIVAKMNAILYVRMASKNTAAKMACDGNEAVYSAVEGNHIFMMYYTKYI